jgi:Domain of unknown function (DUF4436)
MKLSLNRFGIGLVVFIAAYVASIVLYVNDGMGRPRQIAESPPSSDGTTVVVDAEDIQSDNSLLVANYTISPAPQLLDTVTHGLKDDLSLLVTSAVSASKHTWPKGTLPDGFRVSLALNGNAADWPFDRYKSGPITVHLMSGPAQQPLIPTVIMVDRLLGWKIDVSHDRSDLFAPYRLDLYRTTSTVAFGVVILAVLITLAGVALVVAVQTARDRRKFQPPMTTWYAAMLFAVMPLREALPDAPPFGSWIDVTIVLWVIVVLVISLVIYITSWWRHLRPEGETPPERRWTRWPTRQ